MNHVKTFDSLGLSSFVQVGDIKSSRARPLLHKDERLLQDYEKLVGGQVHVIICIGAPSHQGKKGQPKEWQQFTLLDNQPSKFPLKSNNNFMKISGIEIGMDKVSIQVCLHQQFIFEAFYQTIQHQIEDNCGDVVNVDMLELDGDVDHDDPDAVSYDNVT